MIEALELKGVGKSFPNFRLNNISLSLPKGYMMGLVGPNGAGKTATIQLILCILDPASIDDIVICISRGGAKK